MKLSARLGGLEKSRPRCTWDVAIVERHGDEDISARLAEIDRQAEAAGWREGMGIKVMIVELSEEEEDGEES